MDLELYVWDKKDQVEGAWNKSKNKFSFEGDKHLILLTSQLWIPDFFGRLIPLWQHFTTRGQDGKGNKKENKKIARGGTNEMKLWNTLSPLSYIKH